MYVRNYIKKLQTHTAPSFSTNKTLFHEISRKSITISTSQYLIHQLTTAIH